MPATHTVHVDEELAEYLPATHAVQVVEELEEYLPATHVAHVDEEELAAYLPAGQAMHSAALVWPLYLPAAHRTQVPPLGPDEPALHVQSSAESLPDGEFARVGQLEHVEDVGVLVEGHRDELEQEGLAPGLQGRAALGHLRVRVRVRVRVRAR